MENLISIVLNSVFVGNILLAYFLGMCSFLAVSKNLQTATGLGMAVVFVLTITTPANWLVYHFLLAPGALAWAGLPQREPEFSEAGAVHCHHRRHRAGRGNGHRPLFAGPLYGPGACFCP